LEGEKQSINIFYAGSVLCSEFIVNEFFLMKDYAKWAKISYIVDLKLSVVKYFSMTADILLSTSIRKNNI
jgi:hypothetical protein